MRILFVMRNHGYMRNYASTVRMLASRGHDVIVGSRGPERHMAVDTPGYLADLALSHTSITVEDLPRRSDRWKSLADKVRAFRNALRYRHPELRRATALVKRAEDHLARQSPWLAARLPRSWPLAAALSSLAQVIEESIPTDPKIDAVVARLAPDAIVVTPLVDFVSYQADYVKTARHLRIPVAMAVASWDNLTNKGTVAVPPDRVIVWNEAQKREAGRFHGVPADRVDVTGAQLFDDWFDRRPATSRQEFCARTGLDPARPFVLYLCSSMFIARDEVAFVRDWLGQLRGSPIASLREVGVLIRPHPGHASPWAEVDLSTYGHVGVWPRGGEMPLFDDAKAGYFDSMHHAAAVVGINTTGMIEAGIVGRASFTVLATEFAATQGGTLHFAHLTAPGFLRTAATMDQHHRQLAAELASPSTPESLAPFIEQFVRPCGLQTPATPRVVDALEALAQRRRASAGWHAVGRLLRPIVSWLVGVGPSAVRKPAVSKSVS